MPVQRRNPRPRREPAKPQPRQALAQIVAQLALLLRQGIDGQVPPAIPFVLARLEDTLPPLFHDPPASGRQRVQAMASLPLRLQPPLAPQPRKGRAGGPLTHPQHIQHAQQAGCPGLTATLHDDIAKQNENDELGLWMRAIRHMSVFCLTVTEVRYFQSSMKTGLVNLVILFTSRIEGREPAIRLPLPRWEARGQPCLRQAIDVPGRSAAR